MRRIVPELVRRLPRRPGLRSAHEATPAQSGEIEAALGRTTLRLIREAEAEAEAGRAPAVAAAASGASGAEA